MAHFAQLDENNKVIKVIVVGNDNLKGDNGDEFEEIGISFCKKLFGEHTNWKQTSYNNNMRIRYAGVGYSYNEELDAFIPLQPYVSWTLDINTADWVSPLGPAPALTDDQVASISYYRWDEDAYQTDNMTGWVLETSQINPT